MTDISRNLRNLTLRQLRTFHSVARLHSFTAAARALHVTQPAVSMQVRELEDVWGCALYERIGRRIRLTAAGEEVASCAAALFDVLAQTQARLDALRGVHAGELRLAATSTAKYFVPALLAAFQRAHPGVTTRFVVGNRAEVIRHLAASDCDLAIMGRPPHDLATSAQPFARHPLVIVAAPSHALAARRRITLARVARENLIVREPGSGTRAAMEELFARAGLAYRASMEAGSNETIKQAVMAGMGLAFISAHTVGLELASGRLVGLDVRGLPVLREWYVIHLAGRRLSPVAEAFRAFLLEAGAALIAQGIGAAAA